MLTVLVCDLEENITWEITQNVMESYKDKIRNVKSFRNKESILFYMEDHKEEKHIVFMDMEFSNNEGILLASKIRQIQKNTSIVFMSNKCEYDPAIYDVEHVFFLPKPLNKKLIKEALLKGIIKQDEYRSKFLVAVTKSDVNMILLKDIVFIEKEKRKVHVIDIKGNRISFYSCFDDIERQLNKEFCRCHNSYIINLPKVISIDCKSALMNNGKHVPISRSHVKELKSMLIDLSLDKEII